MAAVLSKAAAAGLFTVATILAFLPESRTPALQAALVVLWVSVSFKLGWRYYKAGLLTKSISTMHTMTNKPKTDLLTWAAIIMGSVAMVVTLT